MPFVEGSIFDVPTSLCVVLFSDLLNSNLSDTTNESNVLLVPIDTFENGPTVMACSKNEPKLSEV